MLAQLETRPASADDVPWLIDLRKLTMEGYLKAAGFDLLESDHRDRVLFQFDSIRIVHCDDRDIGMLKVVRERNPWELIQIQILPDCQRQGVATRLINNLLADADKDSTRVELSVLKTNPARALYERLGFRVIDESAHSFTMRTG